MISNFIKIILILCAGITATTVMAQTSDAIKFGTEATYPPFVYMDSNGKLQGFDVDIIKALCHQMNRKCVFSSQPWDSLIPSLKIGKFDALFGGMAVTEEREKQVNFTPSYYINSASFVGSVGQEMELTPVGLNGKIVGTLAGTTFDAYLQNYYGNKVQINRYPSEQDALLDLVAGRVDLVLGDTPLIQQWVKKYGRGKFVLMGNPVENEQYFGKGYGIALRKDNQALLNELSQAFLEIKHNGIYDAIVKKHFEGSANE